MTRKKTILLSISVSVAAVALVGVLLYFLVFKEDIRKVSALEHTSYKVSEFTKSEMQLFDAGTFHIKIIHSSDGSDQLFFIGVGTYEKKGNTYILTFLTAKGINPDDGQIYDVTNKMNQRTTYETRGNRIRFTDNNNQIYYL